MIFRQPTPWENNRQRDLLRCCFHRNPDVAKLGAKKWQETYELDAVTYTEHRVLVRLINRFPDCISTENAKRISGLKRQLWVRGNLNLKIAAPILTLLNELNVPWAFSGEAQWFARPDFAFRESADIIEITVPAKAMSATMLILKQNGWQPGWASPDADAGMVFGLFTKATATIRIVKAEALLAPCADQGANIWKNIVTIPTPWGDLFVPDQTASVALAIGKSCAKNHSENSWIFDLFNNDPDPRDLLQHCGASRWTVARMTRFLTGQYLK